MDEEDDQPLNRAIRTYLCTIRIYSFVGLCDSAMHGTVAPHCESQERWVVCNCREPMQTKESEFHRVVRHETGHTPRLSACAYASGAGEQDRSTEGHRLFRCDVRVVAGRSRAAGLDADRGSVDPRDGPYRSPFDYVLPDSRHVDERRQADGGWPRYRQKGLQVRQRDLSTTE